MYFRKLKCKLIHKLHLLFTPINKLNFKLNGVKYKKNLKTKGLIRILNTNGSVILGENVRINSADWSNPIGFNNRTTFQIFDDARLMIGNNTGISNASITCASEIQIGNNVLIGAGVKIYDTDFHPLDSLYRNGGQQDQSMVKTKSIKIGNGSFIAAGAIILKGSEIGENCVIGAGSVVSGYIPDNEIWGGNPAKFIKKQGLNDAIRKESVYENTLVNKH